jgi:hypothetical protein
MHIYLPMKRLPLYLFDRFQLARNYPNEDTDMPHHITDSVFARTSLTTCDVFVRALAHMSPWAGLSPEEFIDAASPWFLDAETVWCRVFLTSTR